MMLDSVPKEFSVSKTVGWNTCLVLHRKKLPDVYGYLYRASIDFDSLPGLAGLPEELVEINGWWD